MNKKWPAFILLALFLAALFLPAASIHVHSQLGAETAALFPSSVSLWDVMFRFSRALPLDGVPALRLLDPGLALLIPGALLLAAAFCCLFIKKRGVHLSLYLSSASAAFLGAAALHWANLASSLLFTVLITVQMWMYVPFVCAAALAVLDLVLLREEEPLLTDDNKLRILSAVLALCSLVMLLLPVYSVSVPDTLTADPRDAAAVCRRAGLFGQLLGQESSLYAQGQEKGVFEDVLTGDIAALEPYSADGNNIRGIFMIRSGGASANVPMLAGAGLMLLCLVLSLIKKADRWFPLSAAALGAVLMCTGALPLMSVGEADMYSASSRQLLHLGLGHVTAVPLIMSLFAVFSAAAAVMGVRRANSPYFVNPLPQGVRIRFVAAALAVLALACTVLPGATVSFTKPNKNKVQSQVTLSGLDGLLFRGAGRLADPADNKGRAVYDEGEGEYSAGEVNAATARMASVFSCLTWAALLLIIAGLAALVMKKDKKIPISLFLAALAVRLITWIALARGIPRAVGSCSGTVFMYASMVLLVFAPFFTCFAHLNEVPKKYKLFLMTLPFLLAVFLFSYLPLYGWSYAFYNYKFGIPMDQQEFVGLKWFTEMFTNAANRANISRVLMNTLGMSGLNLVTSWLPMIFAVFLNEINKTRFKKFVQIFTTLPNFISWALVFSFAMCLFAADTGIYSKLMMSLGLNDPNNPTVWLNSSDHIWLKMWGWSTWKGLGWGAIMYLAAIAGIDQELYEAARVDGANRWALIRHITLPSLLPTFFVLLMLSISNILNNGMDQYLVFQNPMNRQSIEVLDLYVYNITIASGGTSLYSYATAIGILKTLVSVTLLFSANFLSKKLRGESIM